jgi:hypothetical protein
MSALARKDDAAVALQVAHPTRHVFQCHPFSRLSALIAGGKHPAEVFCREPAGTRAPKALRRIRRNQLTANHFSPFPPPLALPNNFGKEIAMTRHTRNRGRNLVRVLK